MMSVTIGICAFNEDQNIGRLVDSLLAHKTPGLRIAEIIIVSSGSTDNTDRIIREYRRKHPPIRLIIEKSRQGKFSAVNKIIGRAVSGIVVLISADTIPQNNALSNLCLPLKDKHIGVVGARPMSVKVRNTFLGFAVSLLWNLHHEVSLIRPKFGEMIAFRNIVGRIPKTAVDEEEIASIVIGKGLKPMYVPSACVFIKGPGTIRDYILQRRRIYCGHLWLCRNADYRVPTLSNLFLVRLIWPKMMADPGHLAHYIFAASIEAYSRILGYFDYLSGHNHAVWKIAGTTKNLR
ncbi:MAG: glycosyltransferase [archaeon]